MFRIIELKYSKNRSSIGALSFAPMQLEYYVNWVREDIGGHIVGSQKHNISPILLALARSCGSMPRSVVSGMKSLGHIASDPENWEIDYNGNVCQIL